MVISSLIKDREALVGDQDIRIQSRRLNEEPWVICYLDDGSRVPINYKKFQYNLIDSKGFDHGRRNAEVITAINTDDYVELYRLKEICKDLSHWQQISKIKVGEELFIYSDDEHIISSHIEKIQLILRNDKTGNIRLISETQQMGEYPNILWSTNPF